MPFSETWRLFFALPVPDGVRRKAVDLQRQLAPAVGGVVKWVEPENLHVTLKFIGSVPAHLVEQIKHIGQQVAATARGGQLRARGVGAFPNARRPRVLWVGLDGDVEALADAARRLDAQLAAAGIADKEQRPFTAHLTLGRIRRGKRPPDLTAHLAELAGVEVGAVPFTQFVLMRSHLRPSGPVYETVACFDVAGDGQGE